MRLQEFDDPKEKFVEIFSKFMPLAMKIIGLDSLPKMIFEKEIDSPDQPTFGQYVNGDHILYVGLANRHPNDILRTIAHELVHYKQDTEHQLNDMSGTTGSPEENQANALAGIVMRNFNKRYPEFLSSKPIIAESYQGENIGEKLNRTGSNELVIFDIDDTLLHTTAQIKVIKDGKPVRSLTNQEFNNYKLGPGEEFDFGEFRNAQKFEEESVPIGPMLDKLKQDLASGKNVVMLTARADFDDQKAVWRTFKRHGIDINKDVHLFRAGNLPGSESPAVKKAIHVSKWLGTGNYSKIVMYDDSEKNLTVFKSLQKRFPNVEFEAHHVSEEGKTKQVEDTVINELNTAQTLTFIKQAHGDQLYGNLPYWTHPRAVALTGRKIFGAKFNSNAVKTAFLHDVVEDTHISLDELSKLGFDPQVIEAVGLLTKDKSLTYQQNIAKIINSGNPLAMMVKYSDNYENYTGDKSSWASEKAASSQKKYLASLNMLGDKLRVTYHIDENFADGRNPQDKGDSARHGIRKGMTIAQLKKIRSSDSASPRKKQLAHWQINMRQGRKK